MKIHCMLRGGLGNQLFQYSWARKIMLENEEYDELVLYLGGFKIDPLRCFALSNYNLQTFVKTVDGFFPYKYDEYNNIFIKVLRKFSESILVKLFDRRNVFFCLHSNRQQTVKLKKGKDIYLSGYWQSPEYVDGIEDTIRTELSMADKISDNDDFYFELIRSFKNSVCVHIRRGDYVNNRNHFVCGKNYYLEAVRLMSNKLNQPHFFIFSDDISWVKNNIKFANNVHYVERTSSDNVELWLMSQCNNFIISNSSFSWWAQQLSMNKNRIVISPSVWFANGENSAINDPKWEKVSIRMESE